MLLLAERIIEVPDVYWTLFQQFHCELTSRIPDLSHEILFSFLFACVWCDMVCNSIGITSKHISAKVMPVADSAAASINDLRNDRAESRGFAAGNLSAIGIFHRNVPVLLASESRVA